MAVSAVMAVVAVAGTAASIDASKDAQKAQKEQAQQVQAENAAQAASSRRSKIRQLRADQASIAATEASEGTTGSTAGIAVASNLVSDTAGQSADLSGKMQSIQNSNVQQQAISSANQRAQTFGAIGGLATTGLGMSLNTPSGQKGLNNMLGG
ncbi:coil containing protein [Vibrio phage 1.253.O._10N.286.45.B12]|nr:coil containing protein [Vibrio phage 1.235.O._10N.261.52.B2]AUR98543.1 coil containing protein [Vibrio phage 1.253.O._10N.286.45.B12]